MYIFKVGGGLWRPCITGSFINLCWELPELTTVIVVSANSHNIVLLLLHLGHWDSWIIEILGHWDSWVIKSLGHWDYFVIILGHWDSWVIKILDHREPWVIIVGHWDSGSPQVQPHEASRQCCRWSLLITGMACGACWSEVTWALKWLQVWHDYWSNNGLIFLFQCIPQTYYELQPLHILFFVVNICMWISLYHANTVNPGFLPRNIPEYDQAIRQVSRYRNWEW